VITEKPLTLIGYYTFRTPAGNSLDITGNAKEQGTKLELWQAHNGEAQKFNVRDMGGDKNSIRGARYGLSVDISGASSNEGADVIVWPATGNINQQFILKPSGDGWFFIQAAYGPYLAATSDTSGTEIKTTLDVMGAQRFLPQATTYTPSLTIYRDIRSSLGHGPKPAKYQKYIMLHDTEGTGNPQSVINWWVGNGSGVATHFIVGRDGQIWQCVEMDRIAHHAGVGSVGSNTRFNVWDDGRDDVRSGALGGMNAWSIGIEMVHVGGSGSYPVAQLNALDKLIEYIDVYYGFESAIIDHKAWRHSNSDTSPEFAGYLRNYQNYRHH
jgi:hypothetical protein